MRYNRFMDEGETFMEQEDRIASSLEDLLDIYGDMVYRIAFQNMHNQSDAQDIAQDVYLKLYKKMPTFQHAKEQKAWVIRVTINTCKDRWKYNRYRQSVEITPPMECPKEEQHDYGLIYEVAELPINYRNVIYLFYYEEYSVKEIAEVLQKKEKTILTWLHRARKQLKIRLEKGGEQDA